MDNKKLLKFWYWTGRVLPLTALTIIAFTLVFGFEDYIDFLICAIAVIFATFAFSWWWWVLDTVRKLYDTLQSAQDRFVEVVTELKSIKRDLNDSNRKRNKQKED